MKHESVLRHLLSRISKSLNSIFVNSSISISRRQQPTILPPDDSQTNNAERNGKAVKAVSYSVVRSHPIMKRLARFYGRETSHGGKRKRDKSDIIEELTREQFEDSRTKDGRNGGIIVEGKTKEEEVNARDKGITMEGKSEEGGERR